MKTTDAEIRKMLVGGWIAPSGSEWHFADDGSWFHVKPPSSFSGTWQVTDTELTMKIANYSGPRNRSPIGDVLRCTIVSVSDEELVEDLGEALVTLHRQES